MACSNSRCSYLIIVVALGYSRQSVAIGIELVALLFLQQNKLFHFMGLIAVASTFHRTVLVLLVLWLRHFQLTSDSHNLYVFFFCQVLRTDSYLYTLT